MKHAWIAAGLAVAAWEAVGGEIGWWPTITDLTASHPAIGLPIIGLAIGWLGVHIGLAIAHHRHKS